MYSQNKDKIKRGFVQIRITVEGKVTRIMQAHVIQVCCLFYVFLITHFYSTKDIMLIVLRVNRAMQFFHTDFCFSCNYIYTCTGSVL